MHGFDLTFCAPKSVSLVRALRTDDVVAKAIADAHTTALSEAMEYLADARRLHPGPQPTHRREGPGAACPGLVAVAYQHETSRCGDPHLHTHVIVPNRQARADGQIVSIDGTSLYHEARAAGVIYQATLRRELHQSMGFEWAPVDPSHRNGRAGRRRPRHHHRVVAALYPAARMGRPQPHRRRWSVVGGAARDRAEGHPSGQTRRARLGTAAGAVARRCARSAPGPRSLRQARAARRAAARTPFDRARLADAAEKIEKAAFTRADLVEIVGAQLPVDTDASPRELVEAAVDEVGVRLTAPRAAHQREGHERFTLDRILAEEMAVLDLVDARDDRAMLWVKDEDTAGLSPDQKRAVENIGRSPWLVQPLSAPAGAGKTTSMRALRAAAHRRHRGSVLVLAPTGKAVDVAVREGAGDNGYTIAKALQLLRDEPTASSDRQTLVVVDEAAMVGTDDLRQLLTATTAAGAKTVLVGDAHQLAPVKARGGMFAQLCTDLPWTQHLSEVWRMRDPDERAASLALRDGGPAPVRRAVGWYRTHDRLHCGDAITMAADALAAYRADTAAGKDALLVCDTTEMADALNQRIHDDTIDADAPTVTGARGQRIAVGDLIISPPQRRPHRRCATPTSRPPDQIRCATATAGASPPSTPTTIALAARRLDDDARAVFDGDYLREHITHGYAVTVHSAQGVTADTTHAVLGENTTRALLYVAMTRGRDTNSAYLYERAAEHEYGRKRRRAHMSWTAAAAGHAAQLLRAIIANHDQPITAHDIAAQTPGAALPERVRRRHDRRAAAVQRRRATYQSWRAEAQSFTRAMTTGRQGHNFRSRDHDLDDGIEME